MGDLGAIFKAYDVRGLVPGQLDEATARDIGAAFCAEVVGASGESAVVVGHDMRASSPGLATAFAAGCRDGGADVVMIGLASTDLLYFASGSLGLPGAMVTASHNPAGYNGLKLCRPGAAAISETTGLGAIRSRIETGDLPSHRSPAGQQGDGLGTNTTPGGGLKNSDQLAAYAAYLHELVAVTGHRLRVVVDAGNGMAGLTAPAVLGPLDLDLIPLFFELDGTFPHHEANPLDAANLVDLQAAVRLHQADLGLAFDGDADRCFAVDERGTAVSPSALAALIAVRTLAGEPGARIIHNVITSRAVPEVILRSGGVPVRTPVGHSLIKATMAETNAAFGGEHSGHYYFRDFWFADSGMLAALHLLAARAATDVSVSQLVAQYDPYASSGEINVTVVDPTAVLHQVLTAYGQRSDVTLDRLDGLTVSSDRWWFNVRSSNTEPVMRLNVEADTEETMAARRDEVLALMAPPGTPKTIANR
ncbi:MAG TPA: phosphomannomutase/phosphoglucomutase [Nocardioidaceae bacterium]|nr:phosphomannomutase/phosphoglucomutase [Nocardioidaceae bacterium]